MKVCEVEELGCMEDVTATGCAVSRRRAHSLSFTLFEAMWWLSATFLEF